MILVAWGNIDLQKCVIGGDYSSGWNSKLERASEVIAES